MRFFCPCGCFSAPPVLEVDAAGRGVVLVLRDDDGTEGDKLEASLFKIGDGEDENALICGEVEDEEGDDEEEEHDENGTGHLAGLE